MNADGSGQTNLTQNRALDTGPAWSSDGQKIAFTSDRNLKLLYEIYVMNADGSGQTRLTANTVSDSRPAWSPDGQKIAFESDRDGNSEVYVMNANGSVQIRLTENAAFDGDPAWSPDGQKIAFTSERDGNYEVYVMNADGSDEIRLTQSSGFDLQPAWSPDSQRLAFTTNRDGNFELYVMNADGSGQTNLTQSTASDSDPAWSPDGQKLAFTSNREGNFELYVMNADGSGQTRLTQNTATDELPDWGPAVGNLSKPPSVTTDPATSVTSNSAALNVTIDPGGSPTTYKYEYGPTTAFGTRVPASGTLDAGSGSAPVSQPPQSISGLSPGTTYYFRACANNDESGAGTANQVCGAVQAFTTSGTSAPSAVSITATGASVAGTVNAHGQATAYTIEYGTNTTFGSITAPQSAGSGTAGLAVTVPMGGLSPGTTYYYRLVATNATGTTVGALMSFTTVPTAPTVVTGAASALTTTGATLSGSLNPRNGTTTFTFEYGTTTTFGHITAVDSVPGTPAVSRTVSLPVTGLAPATTYLYRLVATNANGTTSGAVMSFKTAP